MAIRQSRRKPRSALRQWLNSLSVSSGPAIDATSSVRTVTRRKRADMNTDANSIKRSGHGLPSPRLTASSSSALQLPKSRPDTAIALPRAKPRRKGRERSNSRERRIAHSNLSLKTPSSCTSTTPQDSIAVTMKDGDCTHSTHLTLSRKACRFVVWNRQHGQCKRCGKPIALTASDPFDGMHAHEIVLRSSGGDPCDTRNVIGLCYRCHLAGSHRQTSDVREWFIIVVINVERGADDPNGIRFDPWRTVDEGGRHGR